MVTLLEPVPAFHILDGAIVATEAEELLPQLKHSQLLHHVPGKTRCGESEDKVKVRKSSPFIFSPL